MGYLGKFLHQEGFSMLERLPWRVLKDVQMWHTGTVVGLTVLKEQLGSMTLRGLFQPKQFYNSLPKHLKKIERVFIIVFPSFSTSQLLL